MGKHAVALVPPKLRVLVTLGFAMQILAGCIEDQSPPSEKSGPALGENGPWTTWASPDNAWVRPGMPIGGSSLSSLLPEGGSCTANFIFTDAQKSAVFVGTAAHCVSGLELGQGVYVGKEPRTLVATLAYSSWMAMGITQEDHAAACDRVDVSVVTDRICWNDFALLEIADGDRTNVNPQVLALGGPTGIGSAPAVGEVVSTYGSTGYREPAGDAADARSGPVLDANAQRFLLHTGVPSMAGDSGSPVLDSHQRAVGIILYLHLLPASTNGAANLDWLLKQAADAGYVVALVPSN